MVEEGRKHFEATTRKEAAEALRQSEERFRMLVARIKDYAIFMLDDQGRVESWNDGAESIKGYKATEIIGEHISKFYTPEDVKRKHPQELLAEAVDKGRVEEEGWRLRKDGTRFWADVIITALRDNDGNLVGFGKVTRDLTERRLAEAALSEVTGRLIRVQDDERRRLSRELADSTSPLLTGLIAKLYNARQQAKGRSDTPSANVMEDALSNAETLSTVIRTVASILHPPLLDESGLLASLKWYLNTVNSRGEFDITTEFPHRLPRFARETELAVFRIVQESITNVARNSGARKITVRAADGEGIEIEIELVGKSLPSAAMNEMRTPAGEIQIGLAGMRERLRQLGGTLEVTIAPRGTVIRASLPPAESPGA